MLNQNKHWSGIIERYKSSDLSQRAFCTQHNISWNQFQYRWSQYNLGIKAKGGLTALESKGVPVFEAVTIRSPSVEAKQLAESRGLVIHFPNHIRCEVAIDLESKEFSLLLKQLVSLC